MKSVVIWGAGETGKRIYESIKDSVHVRFFVDMNEQIWGTEYKHIKIYSPEVLRTDCDFDYLIQGAQMADNIMQYMKEYGVPEWKLERSFVAVRLEARNLFLKQFAQTVVHLSGAVAEAGVYRGEFAKVINRIFPERKCYLFDTFEGFDQRDFAYEKKSCEMLKAGRFNTTAVELVMKKMQTPDMVKVYQGYFPETITEDVKKEKFVFVNLDMDLYKPTLDGLVFFWPRMIEGGILLVHDYFSQSYPNVKDAVDTFVESQSSRIYKMPIGDDLSIALIK